MKEINVIFEDKEFGKLRKQKDRMKLSWREFIIKLSKEFDKLRK